MHDRFPTSDTERERGLTIPVWHEQNHFLSRAQNEWNHDQAQREAAYALGATRWEVTRIAVLSYAKKGLFGAVILGLGRALGETMAVTMVIGNTPQIAASLFKPGYTLASVIANEFTEATTDIYLGALFEIGLVLFGVTILVNLIAQLLLKTMTTTTSATRAVQ